MFTRRMLIIAVLVACVSVSVVAIAQPQPQTAKTKAPVATFKPVQSVHDMMEGQQKLFKDIKENMLDAKWKEARKAAWILAEISNVNQYQSENAEYKGIAKKLSKDCVSLAKLLAKEDEKGARKALSAVGQNCSACHDKFKKD